MAFLRKGEGTEGAFPFIMNDALELREKPVADETYMIAGWQQWADAGSVSSELPRYLIDHLGARQIGRIRPDGFYLYQLPGMHELLRPHIRLVDGFAEELKKPDNELYYWQNPEGKGLVILVGDEPHINVDGYADAVFAAARELGVRRTVTLGGVYAPVPYDKAREISCTYSKRKMKAELAKYALTFSGYEGGASLGSYLSAYASKLRIECFSLYAMVPLYDFSEIEPELHGIGIEEDYRAWYDVMGRLSHMFGLGLDLADLRSRSELVVESMNARLERLQRDVPRFRLAEFRAELNENFTERPFAPLGDVWESELEDLFGNKED